MDNIQGRPRRLSHFTQVDGRHQWDQDEAMKSEVDYGSKTVNKLNNLGNMGEQVFEEVENF